MYFSVRNMKKTTRTFAFIKIICWNILLFFFWEMAWAKRRRLTKRVGLKMKSWPPKKRLNFRSETLPTLLLFGAGAAEHCGRARCAVPNTEQTNSYCAAQPSSGWANDCFACARIAYRNKQIHFERRWIYSVNAQQFIIIIIRIR